jgi:transcriptional regulator with XRE-family HTH domain
MTMTMKMSKGLQDFAAEARKGDSYWVEAAKLQFSIELDRQRQYAGMQYKAVAQKLGTSQAYITKVFRGDSNLTIESMVKLARATGGRLEVSIVDEVAAAAPRWSAATFRNAFAKTVRPLIPTSTALTGISAANHEQFTEVMAA